MALPASGQIKASDIRSELQLNISNFSFAQGAYGSYVRLNSYSPTSPPTSGQVDISDWYSYCHLCDENCGATVYTVGRYEMVIVDLGTNFGKVNFSGYTDGCVGCLSKGTEITTSDNKKVLIEDVYTGLELFNGEEYNVVENIDKIFLNKTYNFNDGILQTSEDHNHFIQDFFGNIVIKKSNELVIGDNFIKSDGILLPIYKIEILHGDFELYNIQSSGNHLFVANDLITHNKCSCSWWIYSSYPYNSSGTLTASTYASGSIFNSTFTGSFNYSSSAGRYAYFFGPTCPDYSSFNGGIQMDCPNINLYWSFSQGATSGTFDLYVNSVLTISETNTNSGNITVALGDSISVTVSATASGGFVGDASTTIIEDSTTPCSDNQTGDPTAYSTCTHTVAGFDLQVYGAASEI